MKEKATKQQKYGMNGVYRGANSFLISPLCCIFYSLLFFTEHNIGFFAYRQEALPTLSAKAYLELESGTTLDTCPYSCKTSLHDSAGVLMSLVCYFVTVAAKMMTFTGDYLSSGDGDSLNKANSQVVFRVPGETVSIDRSGLNDA